MEVDKFKDLKYIVILGLLFFIYLNLFWGGQGSVLYDLGRELYLPSQILKGEVLYKDIFNIYGPFSYMVNAGFYKMFGETISTISFAGAFASFIILMTYYLIGAEFLKKSLAFWVSFYLMVLTIFSPNAFNFILPYSYAMTYALCSFLLSVLFLIKYIKSADSRIPVFAFLACFFTGISIICKYEYLFMPLVLLFVFTSIKPLAKLDFLKSFFILISMPVLFFGILFWQGLQLEHLTGTFQIIQKMSHTKSLEFFYSRIGVYYNFELLLTNLFNMFQTGIFMLFTFGAFLFAYKIKNKFIKSFILVFAGWILTLFILSRANYRHVFCFLPMLVTILALFNIKKLWQNKPLLILVVCAILSTGKTFFFVGVDVYGTYLIPLILIGFVVLFIKLFPENKKPFLQLEYLSEYLAYFFVILTFLTSLHNLWLSSRNLVAVGTEKGKIYTVKEFADPMNKIIKYIENNTSKEDTVLILPETPMINFLTDRPSDSRLNSLIPLYIEAFGEENIIDDLKQKRPKYIIINKRNTIDYGQEYMCKDYALRVCDYVKRAYDLKYIADGVYSHKVYKLKDKADVKN